MVKWDIEALELPERGYTIYNVGLKAYATNTVSPLLVSFVSDIIVPIGLAASRVHRHFTLASIV